MYNCRVESWEIDKLCPHPEQAAFWGDMSPNQFDGLVSSIDKIGLGQPVLIDDEGQIIDGHQRWLACRRLGWTEIPVRVLTENTEQHFVANNWHRRTATQIDKARVVTQLFEKRQADLPRFQRCGNGSLRREIADKLGVDERTVSRYL